MSQTEPQSSGLDINTVSRNSEAPSTSPSRMSERDTEGNIAISTSGVRIACCLFQSAVELLSALLKSYKRNESPKQDDEAALVRIVQSLVLWGDTHGASSGQLDLVLKNSARLQRSTVAPLRLMNEIIVQDLIRQSLPPEDAASLLSNSGVLGLLQQSRHIVDEEDVSEELDDGIDLESADGDSTQDTTEALKVLKTCMQCLADLRSPLETQSEALILQPPASQKYSNVSSKPVDTATSITSRVPQPVTVERITKSGQQLIYELTVIQQPECSRACGTGAKAASDRPRIMHPPIVRLRIFEGLSIESGKDITFSYNANFVIYATVEHARPTTHDSVQRAAPILTGTIVSGVAYLDHPIKAGYFFFPDLSVRHEGNYRLLFDLFEETKEDKDFDPQPEGPEPQINPANPDESTASHDWRMEVKSQPFTVFSAKKFPGLLESTSLTKELAEQGCRLSVRRDVQMRQRDPKLPETPRRTPEPK